MEQPTKYVGPKSTIAKARGAVLAPMPLARREQCALELSIPLCFVSRVTAQITLGMTY